MTIFILCVLVVLAVAGVYDTAYRKVPNSLTLGALVIFFAVCGFQYFTFGEDAMLGALAMGALWFGFWRWGIIGGGDHKLVILSGLVFGYDNVLYGSLLILLWGGLVTVVFVGLSRTVKRKQRALFGGVSVPYALAIFAGTIFYSLTHVAA